MAKIYDEQRIIPIALAAKLFFEDRIAQNSTKSTIGFYHEKLGKFVKYCLENDAQYIGDMDAAFIRHWLVYLQNKGHNPGGVHAHFRAVKTLLIWCENEYDDFRNPIRKVKTPHVPKKQLPCLEMSDLTKLISVCEKDDFAGLRDRAIIFTLLDTGARSSEFLDMTSEDLNIAAGSIRIRNGKGQKERTVFLGKKARRALRKYLKLVPPGPLWLTNFGTQLTYGGLRQIMRRRAEQAGIATPSLHAFRRTFALTCLRNGMDVFSLQLLMGHADLQVLRRYLAQTEGDVKKAHDANSPVDSNW